MLPVSPTFGAFLPARGRDVVGRRAHTWNTVVVRPPLSIALGDIVEMRKPHACGGNQWVVIRIGMDIRVRCSQCGRSVLMPRTDFERAVKRLARGQSGSSDRSDPSDA
jgi:hypothetical protein